MREVNVRPPPDSDGPDRRTCWTAGAVSPPGPVRRPSGEKTEGRHPTAAIPREYRPRPGENLFDGDRTTEGCSLVTLRSFVERTPTPDYTLAVVGDDVSAPMAAMLEDAFEGVPVDVQPGSDLESGSALEPGFDDADADAVVLLEAGEVVATSPLSAVYERLLAINSDRFVTGAADLDDVALPPVLSNLAGSRFELRGYPLAHNEKLVLILVSRVVERRAWAGDGGTLRSGFQRLSRLEDEVGTAETYERLAATNVDVHVYGVPDAIPALEVTVHRGRSAEYRNGWFVVYRPDEPKSGKPAALVALEVEPRTWDGFWTFDPERVRAIDAYVEREL